MERGGLELAAAIALVANAIELLPALLGLPAVTPMFANRIVELRLGLAHPLCAFVIPITSLGRNHAQQECAQERCLPDSAEPLIAGHSFIPERRGILHDGHRQYV
jgi:hypothetical protein